MNVTATAPTDYDYLTADERTELTDIHMALNAAFARHAQADAEIGRLLEQVSQKELYRGADGKQTWKHWLKTHYPDVTGGSALTEEEAQELINFHACRALLLDKSPDEFTHKLPPTKEHVAALVRWTRSADLAVRAWRLACEAALMKMPTVKQVELATQLVVSCE